MEALLNEYQSKGDSMFTDEKKAVLNKCVKEEDGKKHLVLKSPALVLYQFCPNGEDFDEFVKVEIPPTSP